MKTIIIVYTAKKLSEADKRKLKKYAFNTEADLKVGDVLESQSYGSPMQVIKVLEEKYDFYNASTGELSNSYNSTSQWEILDMVIQEKNNRTVYASIRKDDN